VGYDELLFQEQNAMGEMNATIFRLIYPEDFAN